MIAAAVGIALVGLAFAGLLLWWPHFVVRRRATAAGVSFGDVPLASVAAVDAVALDLSTLTTGELKVTSVDPIDPEHERNLRWFAGALGHAAHDPIGRAVAKLATRGRLTDVEEVPGVGISGSVDRHPVRVGAPDWIGVASLDGEVGSADDTIVTVEVDSRALGKITLREVLRDDAASGVAALRELGLAAVVIPGLRPAVTQRLACEVGLAVGETGVVADSAGLALGSGVALKDPSVSSVAAAISIARAFFELKRRCLIVAVIVTVTAVAAAVVIVLA